MIKYLYIIFIYAISLGAEATISIQGSVKYTIDGNVSNSRILRDGQTIKFTEGSEIIYINDDGKPSRLTKQGLATYRAQQINKFYILKILFSKATVRTNRSSTRGANKCQIIKESSQVLNFPDETTYIEIVRNGNSVASYTLYKNTLNKKIEKTDHIKLGDQIIFRKSDGKLLDSYCIE